MTALDLWLIPLLMALLVGIVSRHWHLADAAARAAGQFDFTRCSSWCGSRCGDGN